MALAPTVERELIKNRCSYAILGHEPTASSRETAHAAHVPEDHLAKAVVLRDAAGYLMAIIPGNDYLWLERLRDELRRPLQLVPEDRLEALFQDCAPGAIPPLGPAYGMETLLEEKLGKLPDVYLEGGDHRALVHLSIEEFLALLGPVRVGHFTEA